LNPALAGIAFAAAIVNGALGYGFSSITVPLALLFLPNRVLNPALVLVEVALNAYVLWANHRAVGAIWRRVLPVVAGLAPGIVAGTAIVSQVDPDRLRFGTFLVLLPLILFQAAGYRRPVRSERAAGLALGGTIGVLYAVTTVSGPPLAVMLSNQGLALQEFRAALGLIRLTESGLTAVSYTTASLFTRGTFVLIASIGPGVVVGVPLGAWLIRRVRPETFRRLCMSFDAWVVAFGLSILFRRLQIVTSSARFLVLAAVVVLDVWLLNRFFRSQGPTSPRERGIARQMSTRD
jgi:uncharacterized membrane protein YfcA